MILNPGVKQNEKHTECSHHLGCSNTDLPACDFQGQTYLEGEWTDALRSPAKGLYDYQPQCDSGKFRCHIASPNGCPAKSPSINRYQWIPKRCSLQNFDPVAIDNQLGGGQTILFIGDSLMRQQFNSWRFLMRPVWQSEEDALRNEPEEFSTVAGNRFVFEWAKYLVDESVFAEKHQLTLRTNRKGWPKRLIEEKIDYVVMNVGHHWHKLDKQFGQYEAMVQKVLRYFKEHFRGKRLIFRTSTPGHYECQQSDLSGAPIDYVPPLTEDNDPFNWRKPIRADLLWAKEATRMGLSGKFRYLNVSHSIYRSDAHVEYKIRSGKQTVDCLHWCLPGVPGKIAQICLANSFTINSQILGITYYLIFSCKATGQ